MESPRESVVNPLAEQLSARAAARPKSSTKVTIAWVAALSVAGGTVLGGVAGGQAATLIAQEQQDARPSVQDTSTLQVSSTAAVAKAAAQSVVTVSVTTEQASGTGSGVVVAEGGYIVTNNHVVSLDGQGRGARITVETADGQLLQAELVGTDPAVDLAVLKVDADLPAVAFADSAPSVGDEAVAIGSPLGLSNTVTDGIISATGRGIQLSSEVTVPVMQTDAPINPGNSGGALLNGSGELVGINVAIADASPSQSGAQEGASGSIGIGFAIEGDLVQRVANEIIEHGEASHGLLGATVTDQTDARAGVVGATLHETTESGAAAEAGLRSGDVITAVDGTSVTGAADLTARIRSYAAGEEVAVTLMRDGEELELTVQLGEMP
ncbi:S1C family serine protease [Agrococcus casei]|uniref:HtrA protease/chaperone protein / Serine protease (Protease DO) n=1 Tax=Agrococcus casei LMG 22410 TaxID=1255656 RepID=A0A1R4FWF2_9MICO|nr:trypsin-like peptidase domain-containing protein [Agrococcus casei]SJM60072.1 HtrA protease/chaperone protein / Serine protease (Protease DO) [Agrococcus casei LMG 22410]